MIELKSWGELNTSNEAEAGCKKTGVIHFDSHPDICDTYDSHKWSHACTERRTTLPPGWR